MDVCKNITFANFNNVSTKLLKFEENFQKNFTKN